MPARTSIGGTPPKRASSPTAKALDETPARFDLPNQDKDDKAQLAPVDQDKAVYKPGEPIKFYDEEVKRVHAALNERAESDRRAARRSLRTPPPRPRRGVTWTGFFVRVAIFYVAIAYFLVCPHDSSRERAVCRQLDSLSARLESYEPTFRPYYRRAQKKLDPYVRRGKKVTEPYVAKTKPYYARVDQVVSPRLRTLYDWYLRHVYPKLVATVHNIRSRTRPLARRVEQEYTKSLAPSVDWYSRSFEKWYSSRVEPSLNQLYRDSRRYSQTAADTVSPIWTSGVPLAQHHYRTNVVPFSRKTYSIGRKAYVSHVHPRILSGSSHVQRVYKAKVYPSLQRFWSVFIAPQLDKIRERIFEFKAKEARVEALKRVEKASEEIAKEHGEGDFEDFIKELRDDTYVGETASPVIDDVPPPPAYSSVSPPPPSREEQAALTAEKRAALETLQSTYEREIAALGQTEQRLLVNRLADIRRHALEDIPARFDVLLETLDEEGDKMVGKLGRYFTKVSSDDKATVESKVDEAQALSEKAKVKVQKMRKEVEKEIEQYRVGLRAKEAKAVDEAKNSITALVGKAQEELGFGWTWLDDVTHKDWQRYHGLRKAEENLHKSFANLQSGSIRESVLSELDPETLLDKYAKQPASLVSTFETILAKITLKGQKELKGEWTGVTDEAQKAYVAVGDKMAALVGNVKDAASSVAGAERKPTNVAESMASIATAAQQSASSLAAEALKALPTVEAHHDYTQYAKHAYGEASQSILRAAGIEPSPTDLRQSAGFIVSAAQSSAAEAYAKASRSAYRAAGFEPAPTDLAESAASVARAAQSSAAAAYSNVVSDYPSSISSALAAATDAVDSVAQDVVLSASSVAASAASAVSSLAAPHSTFIGAAPVADRVGDAKEHVNEFFGEVSQQAVRAVGAEPTPTDVRQSVTSLVNVVSSAVSDAGSAVSSLAEPHTDFAKRSVASAASPGGLKSSMASIASGASSAIHAATRTTAEGMQETASSVASVAKESIASVASAAESLAAPHSSYTKSAAAASVKSVVDGASGAVASASSAIESLASPHPSYAKSSVAASAKSVVDDATGAFASATAQVKSVAHEALHVEL
ncbi:hypothetical protein JCM10212_006207 [Sporobolomyces blumeae]